MKQVLPFVGLLALSTSTFAAGVDGTLTTRLDAGAQNAEIIVVCGNFEKHAFTSMTGDYYIGGVPDKTACTLTIKYQNVSSDPHKFTTTTGTTTFSKRIEPYEGKLVFIH